MCRVAQSVTSPVFRAAVHGQCEILAALLARVDTEVHDDAVIAHVSSIRVFTFDFTLAGTRGSRASVLLEHGIRGIS
jgi:hypothetical protein